MPTALFEVPYTEANEISLLFEIDIFDSGPVQCWQLLIANAITPTTTVLIKTSTPAYNALVAHADVLWIADTGSPVHDAPVTAQGANETVQWLKDNGYSGAEFGQAIASIQSSRSRIELATAMAALHNVSLDEFERPVVGS